MITMRMTAASANNGRYARKISTSHPNPESGPYIARNDSIDPIIDYSAAYA